MAMLNEQDKARELAKVLKCITVEPRTAKRIAELCDCTKPTAYSRLQALRDAGYIIDEDQVRDGATGPKATAYRLRVATVQLAAVPRNQVLGVARSRAKQRRAEAVAGA